MRHVRELVVSRHPWCINVLLCVIRPVKCVYVRLSVSLVMCCLYRLVFCHVNNVDCNECSQEFNNGITGDDIGALVRAGIKTMRCATFATREELMRAVGGVLGEEKVDRICHATASLWMRAEYARGPNAEPLQRLPPLPGGAAGRPALLSTGVWDLDRLLQGGIVAAKLTQVSGEYGTGELLCDNSQKN